ncbi:type II secretion system protein GspN [bacterium]|nr:type II secretion system protein GspN [bacterium]
MNKTKQAHHELIWEIIGLTAVFVCFCLIFLVIKLPRTQIRDRIMREVVSATDGKLEIVDLAIKPIMSFRAAGAGYKLNSLSGEEVMFSVRDLHGSLHLLPFLIGKTVIATRADLNGGRLKCEITSGKGAHSGSAYLSGSEIPLQSFNQLLNPIADLAGTLDLHGNISWDKNDLSTGKIEAQANEARLLSFSYKGLELPEIIFEQVKLLIEIESNLATVKTLTLEGPDLTLQLDGSINLRQPLQRSSLDLIAHIRIDQDSLKKLDLAMFSSFLTPQHGKPVEIPIKGSLASPKADITSLISPPVPYPRNTP